MTDLPLAPTQTFPKYLLPGALPLCDQGRDYFSPSFLLELCQQPYLTQVGFCRLCGASRRECCIPGQQM